MFTQKCFIRKNTPELVTNLNKFGYRISFSAKNGMGDNLYTENNTLYAIFNKPISDLSCTILSRLENKSIDCGTNEELFLAIAALRDDDISLNDKINEINKERWHKCH